ncbi:Response regulator of zinc sigma-54-dependent two-component system [Archangium gephyra]|uniref:Response regulator of zinc sigma-54-dependent two-component system n=1 Tax=Archangium gephyra TaxID=48 RepID=A0AAC8QJP9_9BACT|nr:Response regulator of zinc sigma-54-dependent two-component system [Archangium gephyra]
MADQLQRHDWPGNVRELRNAMERVVALSRGPRVELEDLPEDVRAALPVPALTGEVRPLETVEREYILAVLARNGGNRTRTAKELGIGATTLYASSRATSGRRADGSGEAQGQKRRIHRRMSSSPSLSSWKNQPETSCSYMKGSSSRARAGNWGGMGSCSVSMASGHSSRVRSARSSSSEWKDTSGKGSRCRRLSSPPSWPSRGWPRKVSQ